MSWGNQGEWGVGGASTGYPVIPQVSTDPSPIAIQKAWVLRTSSVGSGGGVLRAFLGLSFPYASAGVGGSNTYQLSYRTREGTTKRVTIS